MEASLFFKLKQLNTDDNKLNTIDINNNKNHFANTWFWNQSINETNSDFKKERYNNINKKYLGEKTTQNRINSGF